MTYLKGVTGGGGVSIEESLNIKRLTLEHEYKFCKVGLGDMMIHYRYCEKLRDIMDIVIFFL